MNWDDYLAVGACFVLAYMMLGLFLGKTSDHPADPEDEYVKASDLFGWPMHVFGGLFKKKQGDE